MINADNGISRLKPCLDAIEQAGIVGNDRDAAVSYAWYRVRTKAEQKVEVVITDA